MVWILTVRKKMTKFFKDWSKLSNNRVLEHRERSCLGDIGGVSGVNENLACQWTFLVLEIMTISKVEDISESPTSEDTTSGTRRPLWIFRGADWWTDHVDIMPELL
jgi:hypothetical protein